MIFLILSSIVYFFSLVRVIKHRALFNIATYSVWTVIPLILYLLDWSYLIVKPISSYFYLIVGSFLLCISLVSFVEGNTPIITKKEFVIRNIYFIDAYTAFFVFCFLLENYILTGHLLPAMVGIDVHTERVGVLMWITNSFFLPLSINYLGFLKTRRKRFLVYTVFIVLLPFFGKGSRLDIVMNIVQLLLLICFVNPVKKKKHTLEVKRSIKRIIFFGIAIALLLLLCYLVISIAVFRATGEFSIESQYALSIDYCGPGSGFFREVLAWSYGYFAMSFNNLNNNIINTQIHPNYLGFNSFKALWFGLFRGSWFGFESDVANRSKRIIVTSATTTTVFWDFYYDYSSLVVIPIILLGLFYYVLKKSITKSGRRIGSILNYIYWSGLFFFISFNNTVFFDCVFINFIINAIVSSLIFKTIVLEQVPRFPNRTDGHFISVV